MANTPEENRTLAPIGYTVEKKSLSTKFAELFLADSIDSIKKYVLTNILIPNLKRFFADSAHGAVDAFFYKKSGQGTYNGNVPWSTGTSFANNYSAYYSGGVSYVPQNNPNDIYEYKSLGWTNKDLADRALATLRGEIAQYGTVSINTYLALMSRTGPLNGWNYGWRNLGNEVDVFSSGGYWFINFPEPEKIK